jgi:hypothetical protein
LCFNHFLFCACDRVERVVALSICVSYFLKQHFHLRLQVRRKNLVIFGRGKTGFRPGFNKPLKTLKLTFVDAVGLDYVS